MTERAMPRVVGTDPGTGSLDLLLLEGGSVVDQARLAPATVREDPEGLLRTLRAWEPLDLIAGPSGYGVPLLDGGQIGEAEIELMSLVRPEERGTTVGVGGLRRWIRDLTASGFPTVFLPGAIHLPTVPAHRKRNRIDLGTPDKLAVTALALRAWHLERNRPFEEASFAVVEVGSAFTSLLVVERGRVVDAAAGTAGPIGLRSGGVWDGEAAYWLGPLSKTDLFRGGLADLGPDGPEAFRESLRKQLAGLKAVTPFERVWLSGAGLDRPEVARLVNQAVAGLGEAVWLPPLQGTWVKHAAQGAALLADGLAGGESRDLVESLALRQASGTILDYLSIRPTGRPEPPKDDS